MDHGHGPRRARLVQGHVQRGRGRRGDRPRPGAAGIEPDLCPVADGGEGTQETLLASIGGEGSRSRTSATRWAARSTAEFALSRRGAARSSRWRWRAASRSSPRPNATRGRRRPTAPGSSCRRRAAGARDLVAVGGAATVDGGRGALDALEDARRDRRRPDRRPLRRDHAVGALRGVYGPQKGADAAMVSDSPSASTPTRRAPARPARRRDDGRGGRAVGRPVGPLRRRARTGRAVRPRRRPLRRAPARLRGRDRR